jgi:glycosyltransferase involved in cell wall biosynthesis
VPTILTLHDYWFLCPRHTLLRGDRSLCERIPEDPAECAWCYMYATSRKHQRLDALSGGLYRKAARALMPGANRDMITERRKAAREALSYPRFVIAPSEFLASRFADSVDGGRLRQLRLGLDLAPFAALADAHPREGATDPLRVGFIGQVAEHKGVHVLVEAFQHVRPGNGQSRALELHIHGGPLDTPYAEGLRRKTAGDSRVHWRGRFDNTKVNEVLADLDVAVVPSVWYENLPLAILESLAAGVPVIASRAGGMIEMVRDGESGLQFTLADPADLARQLQRLADEPALLPRLRSGARANRPSSVDEEMAIMYDLYEQAVHSK